MLLLLHSTFILSVVKILLKGKVGGGFALNSHGNYIVYHGKIMELFFGISVGTLIVINLQHSRPRGYTTRVHSLTQNKEQ